MSEDNKSGIVGDVTNLIKTLSFTRLILAIALGTFGLVAWALLDLRAQWGPILIQSPMMIVGISMGLLTLAGWAAAGGVYIKISGDLERAQQQMLSQTNERVAGLEQDLEAHLEKIDELNEALTEVRIQERECRVRVALLQEELRHLKERSRRSDPPNSTY